MEFLDGRLPAHDLTYDDVFMVPRRSSVTSRYDVDLSSGDEVATTIPLVVANMTAVAGRRMSETVARRGGITILPQDIPQHVVTDVISSVKACHPVYETPIVLRPEQTVGEALNLIPKRSHRAAVVLDGQQPVGLVTLDDCEGRDRFTQVREVMSTDLLTLSDSVTAREAFDVLDAARRRVAPVVAADGSLAGVMTREGALRSTVYAPALDAQGRLLIGAAIGVNGNAVDRAKALLADEVDCLVIDTAHGHQERMIDVLRAVRSLDPGVPVVAGNVVSVEGTIDLIEAGADIVKVGVGPGRHVHDADDDRGGPPPVLGGVGLGPGSCRHGPPRVGRRGSAASSRRGARPGGRGVTGDDRLVVRGHQRVPGGSSPRRERPGVQGELRHGQRQGRGAAHRSRVGLRPGPQEPLRGRHLGRVVCISTPRARAWRT